MRSVTSTKTIDSVCLNTPVLIQHGSEGPSHDPYSFEEFTYFLPNNDTDDQEEKDRVVIHLGLGDVVKVNNVEVARGYENVNIWVQNKHKMSIDTLIDTLREEDQISTCPRCGCKDLVWKSGFPGESLLICTECEEICDTSFNPSEIE